MNVFQMTGKKTNIIPIHKKGDKQIIKVTCHCHSCLFVAKLYLTLFLYL